LLYKLLIIDLICFIFFLPGYVFSKVKLSYKQKGIINDDALRGFFITIIFFSLITFVLVWLKVSSTFFFTVSFITWLIFFIKCNINKLTLSDIRLILRNFSILLFCSFIVLFLFQGNTDSFEHIGKIDSFFDNPSIGFFDHHFSKGLKFEFFVLLGSLLKTFTGFSFPIIYIAISGYMLFILFLVIQSFFHKENVFVKMISTFFVFILFLLSLYESFFQFFWINHIYTVFIYSPFLFFIMLNLIKKKKLDDYLDYSIIFLSVIFMHPGVYLNLVIILFPFLFIFRFFIKEKSFSVLMKDLFFSILIIFFSYLISVIYARGGEWRLLERLIFLSITTSGVLFTFLKKNILVKKIISWFSYSERKLFLFLLIPMIFIFLSDYGNGQFETEKIEYFSSAHTNSINLGNFIVFDPRSFKLSFLIVNLILISYFFFNKRKYLMQTLIILNVIILSILFFPPLTTFLVKLAPLWLIDRIREFYNILTCLVILKIINQKKITYNIIFVITCSIILINVNDLKMLFQSFPLGKIHNFCIQNSDFLITKRELEKHLKSNDGKYIIYGNSSRLFEDYMIDVLSIPVIYKRNQDYIDNVFFGSEKDFKVENFWIDLFENDKKMIDNLKLIGKNIEEKGLSIAYSKNRFLLFVKGKKDFTQGEKLFFSEFDKELLRKKIINYIKNKRNIINIDSKSITFELASD